MLHGVFRTKEGKLGAVALIIILIIVVTVFALNSNGIRSQYREQTVMAERYLNEGNYEKAVEAYLRAMSIKKDDGEELVIGLAKAYVGVKDYDKALEVLRTGYQSTQGTKIKEKIEEVTLAKTEYDYLQIISRAEIYFNNEEHAKAITEYEKAKQIKSKEVTSYLQIAKAYIKLGEYNKALTEVQSGLALTENEDLNALLEDINRNLLKEQYNIMIANAEEYIFQENYDEGIKKYHEASQLLPEEPRAYIGIAQVYLDREEYNKAVLFLEGATKVSNNKELYELLDKAKEALEMYEEGKQALAQLYAAANKEEMDKVLEIMRSKVFQEMIISETPKFYNAYGERNTISDYGIIVYNSKAVYCGALYQGMRTGSGINILLTPDLGEQSYYYYNGEWNNDLPNGVGKTQEVVENTTSKKQLISKTVTEGTFYNSKENGIMHKFFYSDGKETGNVRYTAKEGVPVPAMDQNGEPIFTEPNKPYGIGILYHNNKPTQQYYMVESKTLWGVKPFIGD